MQHDVLIDGVEADGDWLNERAFQFGDGLFETIAVIDGIPCLWDAHIARLAEGCQRLSLPLPDLDSLAEECARLCAGHSRAVIKILWTAGRSERGYRRPRPLAPQRILRRSAWQVPQSHPGWIVRQCRHRLSENPALAQIKHLNRLDQVVARAEWDDPLIDEGLMLGQDGRVVCATMSNLFVQRGGALITPAVDRAGVAGVVRDLVIKVAEEAGQRVCVDAVSLDQVRTADALFLTNSLIGVARISRYESTDFDLMLGEHAVMAETRRRCHQSFPQSLGHE